MAFDLVVWVIYLFSLYYGIFWFLVYLDYGTKDQSPKSEKSPLVTIAIPAYNEEESIAATIESVTSLDYPKDKMEILVINDGSKDRTAEIVESAITKKKNYSIRLINQQNGGKGSAMNNALRQAKGAFFISLDADSYVRSDALKVIMPYFEDKEVSCVLPVIKVKNPRTLMQKLQYVEYLVNFFYKKLMSRLDCIHVTPGPFSVYRTEILRNLGGYDENNLTEDLEMALRLQKHHYKIEQILGTEVLTDAPENFKAFYKQRNRWYKGSLINVWNYRNILFNRSYGEFGMFHLPAVFSVALIAIVYVTYILSKYVFKPTLNYINDMSYINFNIPFAISKSFEHFSILDLNYMTMFLGLSIIAISLIVLKNAFKFTQERMRTALFSSSLFLLFYPTVLAITWLGVVFDLVRGKRQKW